MNRPHKTRARSFLLQADKSGGHRRQRSQACPHHPDETLKFYCSSHQDAICCICAIKYHKTCNETLTYPETIERFKKDKNAILVSVDKARDAIEDTVVRKQDLVDVLRAEVSKVHEDIEQVCEKLHRVIDVRKRGLLETLDNMQEELVQQQIQEIETLERLQDRSSLAKESAEMILDRKWPFEMTNSISTAQSSLNEIEQTLKAVKESNIKCIEFEISNEAQGFLEQTPELGFLSFGALCSAQDGDVITKNSANNITEIPLEKIDTSIIEIPAPGKLYYDLEGSSSGEDLSFDNDSDLDDIFIDTHDISDEFAELPRKSNCTKRECEEEVFDENRNDFNDLQKCLLNVFEESLVSPECELLPEMDFILLENSKIEEPEEKNVRKIENTGTIQNGTRTCNDGGSHNNDIKITKSDEKDKDTQVGDNLARNDTDTNNVEISVEKVDYLAEEFEFRNDISLNDGNEIYTYKSNDVMRGTEQNDLEFSTFQRGEKKWHKMKTTEKCLEVDINSNTNEAQMTEYNKIVLDFVNSPPSPDTEILITGTEKPVALHVKHAELQSDFFCTRETVDEVSEIENYDNKHTLPMFQSLVTDLRSLAHASPCWIHGLAFLTDGRLLLTDVAHDSVQMFDTEQNLICDLATQFTPWAIACTSSDIVAISAGSKGVELHSVKDNLLTRLNTITIDADCISVAACKNQLVIGTRKGVILMSETGDLLKTIDHNTGTGEDFRRSDFVCLLEGDVIFSNTWSGKIICITAEGKQKWVKDYYDEGPRGICSSNGRLIIANKGKKKISFYNKNGTLNSETVANLVEQPYALAHHPHLQILAVSQWDDKMLGHKSREVKLIQYW